MINIRGRYNEGYEDGYKVGYNDFKYKMENSIIKYDVDGNPMWNMNKLFDLLNKEFKRKNEKGEVIHWDYDIIK
jgi:hypothetical protein